MLISKEIHDRMIHAYSDWMKKFFPLIVERWSLNSVSVNGDTYPELFEQFCSLVDSVQDTKQQKRS